MKIIAITQARMGSSRLPGKILKEVDHVPLLKLHLDRIGKSEMINGLLVATTTEPQDDQLVQLAAEWGYNLMRGSTYDVLDRYYQAALPLNPDYVVRLTSDCPLIDPLLIDQVVKKMLDEKVDYISNGLSTSFPDGQDIEVFRFSALTRAWQEAKLASEREHVTPYIWKNSSYLNGELFTSANYQSLSDYSMVRMTVDEEVDYHVILKMVEILGLNAGWQEYADLYLSEPSIKELNKSITRNEGYLKSINGEI